MMDAARGTEGWRWVRLEQLGLGSTRSVLPSDYPDEELELWSVPSFPSGRPEIARGASIGSNKQLVEPNDVLLCKINPRINRVWKVGAKGSRRQIASTEWIVLRPKAEDCDPDYLVWALREPAFRQRLCQDVSGVGGSLTRARPSTVKNLEVPVAPRDEQRRIVAWIDKRIESVRTATRLLLEASRDGLALQGALLLDCITSGGQLRAPAHFMASGAVDTLPPQWELVQLGDLVTGGPKNGYSPSSRPDANGTLTLRLSATTSGSLVLNEATTKHIDEVIQPDSPLWLRPGDLLVQRANTIDYVGTAAVYEGPEQTYIYPDLMSRMRFEHEGLAYWVAYLLNSRFGREWVRAVATGTAGNMPKINGASLRRMWVPLPPLDEMRRLLKLYAGARTRVDSLAATIQEQTAAVTGLETSILSSAFTGRI